MPTHRINIHGAGPYTVEHAGKTIVTNSVTPIHDAARALKAAGAHDRDVLHAMFGGCSIMPAALGAITRPRAEVRKSDIKRLLSAF